MGRSVRSSQRGDRQLVWATDVRSRSSAQGARPLTPPLPITRTTSTLAARPATLDFVTTARMDGERKGGTVRIVVIGGTGLIGSRLVANLAEQGHEAVPASPRLGINTITGAGLAAALAGTSVVVDVSNSPNFEYATALGFFERSTHNLLAAAEAARVGHVVALSVVGTKAMALAGDPEASTAGYFRAKLTQEELIAASGLPYSIVHATQFFEFLGSIADTQMDGGIVLVPDVAFQPMAADDVATGMGAVAAGPPANGIIEIGGPERVRFEEPIRLALAGRADQRDVVADAAARYYGIPVGEDTLVPGPDARLGSVRLEDWLRQTAAETAPVA